MTNYQLPQGMRYSTLEERRLFYEDEFDISSVKKWFGTQLKNVVFAVIIGRHTGIFPPEYAEDESTTILIDEYSDLTDVKRQIIMFTPESVYYDRNVYDENGKVQGQELAFDIDPENLTCPVHGTLEDKMKRRQGLSFCETEFKMAKEEAARLYGNLFSIFSKMRLVYSGRGFHIHVLDSEAYDWNYQKRYRMAKKLKKDGFRIDEWVTSGTMRLIRLPFSLHGMVSRIAVPIKVKELEDFDPVHDEKCLPRFLYPH